MPNLKYIGKNVLNHSLILKKGNVSGSFASTGSLGRVETAGNLSVAGGTLFGPTNDHFDINSGKNIRLYLDSDNNSSFCKFQVHDGSGDTVFAVAESGNATIGEGITANHVDGLSVVGSVSASADGTGSFGLAKIGGTDLNPTGVSRDQVLKYNGTKFVPAAYDATFEFSIADFDMNHTSTPVLIGSGSWKAVGDLTFTVSYNNGPPDGFNGSAEGAPKIQGYVDGSVSSSYDMYPLSSSFTTGTNTMAITFPPDATDDIRFRLYASAGSDTDNDYTDQRIYFYNQFVYGDLSKNNGFNQADIRT